MSYSIVAEDHERFAILTDTTLCTGCETCVNACHSEYDEKYDLGEDRNWRWKQRIDDLSSSRFTTIIRRAGNKYVRQQCRHCNEPACVSACIVGALEKHENGPVTYDEGRCMGCRYCMMACPYGIPRYSWQDTVPLVRKCILCHERVQEGLQPRCTESCPYGATIFGTRAEMIAEANRRIAENPGKYAARKEGTEPELWGHSEVGGVSVLYLSDIPLDFLSWGDDELGDKPLPALTWAAISKVPPLALGVAAAMGGIYWVIGRRMRLAYEAQQAAQAEHKQTDQQGS